MSQKGECRRSVARRIMSANKRIKYVRYAHPTRKGEAPLLAAYAQRWAGELRWSYQGDTV